MQKQEILNLTEAVSRQTRPIPSLCLAARSVFFPHYIFILFHISPQGGVGWWDNKIFPFSNRQPYLWGNTFVQGNERICFSYVFVMSQIIRYVCFFKFVTHGGFFFEFFAFFFSTKAYGFNEIKCQVTLTMVWIMFICVLLTLSVLFLLRL